MWHDDQPMHPARARIHETTRGEALADKAAALIGSWRFLICQAAFLLLWLLYNSIGLTQHFDSPPFILLNLLLSFQAGFTGPVLLIAANRSAARDRLRDDTEAREVEELTTMNRQQLTILQQQQQILALLRAQASGSSAHNLRGPNGRFVKRDAA